MTRDILGKRIKRNYSASELDLFEKYYLYNQKIYQIIRIKRFRKLEGYLFDLQLLTPNHKIIKTTVSSEIIENTKFFSTKKGLIKSLF